MDSVAFRPRGGPFGSSMRRGTGDNDRAPFARYKKAWNSLYIGIMTEKQPKRPNNNAKALENWESEGGAPASDDRSTKRKRPPRPKPDHEGPAPHGSQNGLGTDFAGWVMCGDV